jgi:long-chain fatty acid transport protein
MSKRILSGVLASCLFYGSVCFASNCLEPIGWGARAVGRGGVEIAVANDTSALNSNPAGMAQIEDKQLDIGFGVFSPKIRFQNRYGKRHTRVQYYPAPEFGYVAHMKDRPIALGIGVFGNSGLGVHHLYINNPYFARPIEGDSKLGVGKVIAAIAYKFNEKLYAGLAFNFYYVEYSLASSMGEAYLDADKMHGPGYGATIGLLYHPSSKWSFGLSYTFKPHLEDLHTDDSRLVLPTGQVIDCRTRLRNFGVPRKLCLGTAYHPTDRWIIGMDLEWQQYSRAFNEFIIDLTGMVGPDMRMKLPFHFRDTYIFSIGTEYELMKYLTLRCGYSFSKDVSPDDSHFAVSPLLDDFHNISVGFGIRWRKYELNGSFVYGPEGKGKNNTAKFPKGNPAPEFSNSITHYKDMHFNVCVTRHF